MTKKREKPFHLDMGFDEALKRVAQTDPRELPQPKKKTRKKATGTATASRRSSSPQRPRP